MFKYDISIIDIQVVVMNRKLGFQLFVLLGIVVVGMIAYATTVSLANRYSHEGIPYGHNEMEGMGGCCDDDRSSTSYISTKDGIRMLEEYVQTFGENFKLKEVMEFQNNFYAVVVERDTGMGAFEVLLWKTNGRISPEPGPNMMWNLKYGMHAVWTDGKYNPSIEEAQAIGIAEDYLKYKFPGRDIEIEEPIAFYGYYTMDFKLDGEMYGMLSVNAFTGNVWYHSWHGNFLSEVEMDSGGEF